MESRKETEKNPKKEPNDVGGESGEDGACSSTHMNDINTLWMKYFLNVLNTFFSYENFFGAMKTDLPTGMYLRKNNCPLVYMKLGWLWLRKTNLNFQMVSRKSYI